MKKKSKTTKTVMMTVASVALASVVVGCGGRQEAEVSQAPAVDLPDIFVDALAAATAVPIPEARNNLKPGDSVILTGLVMGTKYPFVEGRGVFVLGDEGTLTPCGAMGAPGHCPTPWDTCCDTPAARVAGTASIQVLGAAGKVLARGLKGAHGLQELSRVTVVGKVAPSASPEAFIVNASAIHVVVE